LGAAGCRPVTGTATVMLPLPPGNWKKGRKSSGRVEGRVSSGRILMVVGVVMAGVGEVLAGGSIGWLACALAGPICAGWLIGSTNAVESAGCGGAPAAGLPARSGGGDSVRKRRGSAPAIRK